VNRDELRALIRLVEESEIDELEIRRWGRTVRIVKNLTGAHVETPGPDRRPARPARRQSVPASPGTDQEESSESGTVEDGGDLHEVASPMVGTFYRAPSPEAPPFVEIGDRVRPGQTLCILEAMKLMNELQSEVTGVVREILVENAEPVEYGQALFRIETS